MKPQIDEKTRKRLLFLFAVFVVVLLSSMLYLINKFG